MYRFLPRAPFDLTPLPAPEALDRRGPPLSQGSLLTMFSVVAGLDLSAERRAALAHVDPEAWYHGQVIETLLTELEEKDPALPELVGRSLYFMLREGIEKMGLTTPLAVAGAVPTIWIQGTRGDGGEWRLIKLEARHAILEAEQPYNCHFEAGALRGLVEAFDGYDVTIDHRTCMRRGDPFCTLDLRWKE